MFDFIPLEYYTPIYYYLQFLVVFLVFLKSKTQKINSNSNKQFLNNSSIFLLVFTVFYMGFRPISGRYFGDTGTYNSYFVGYQNGGSILVESDYLFHAFTFLCSKIMSASVYFFVCALLYVVPMYYISKKWFKAYWGYAFLFLVVSFSFWSAGTNGVRSAIATSFVLLAFSRKNILYKVLWFSLAIGFHKSMLLPIAAYGLTFLVKNPKWFFYGWLLCIPLSLAGGGFWETLFAGLIEDDRVSYLTDGNVNDDNFSSTAFRWDFLLYSFTAVFAAYYFIYKRKFKNENYNRLASIYLTTNAFWILVIRANFSNRFAYLSWFMLGLIIIYPLISKIIIQDQNKKTGYILLAYFGFTFLMNVILAR
jgi:hypothetical protein